jgi:hypothetical protein
MVVKLAAGVEILEDARPSNVSLLPVSICYQKTLTWPSKLCRGTSVNDYSPCACTRRSGVPGRCSRDCRWDVILILGRDLRGMMTQTWFQRPGKLLQRRFGEVQFHGCADLVQMVAPRYGLWQKVMHHICPMRNHANCSRRQVCLAASPI